MNEAPGTEDIADQHTALSAAIRRVRDAHEGGSSWNDLALLLDQLIADVDHHFSTEETLMLRAAYPGYHDHHAKHVAFVGRLAALRRQCDERRSELMGVLVQLLESWFKNHESTADRHLDEFLATRV